MNVHFLARNAIAPLVLAAASLSQPVDAAARCEQSTVGGDARACAALRDGPVALRRFIWRTRAIYGLRYQDFAPPEADALAPAGNVRRVAISGANTNTGLRGANPDARP
jgi:hypothetical protein